MSVFLRFLFITAIVYCLVIVLLYQYDIRVLRTTIPDRDHRKSAFTARKLEEIMHIKSLDVLIMGSSLAYRNYDPQILETNGFSSFTLGTSSQKPNMTNVVAMRYLQTVQSKLIILDVNPYLMMMPDSFETVDVIMNSHKNKYDWDLFTSEPSLLSFNSLIIKYFGLAEKDRQEKLKDSVVDRSTYLGNGFVTSNLMYDDSKKTPDITIKNFTALQNQADAMDEIISYFKTKNIPYVLVLSPVNEHFFRKKSKISSQEFRELSRDFFEKYGNYYDANEFETYQKSDFMDFSHLNQKGSEKFTNSLIPILQKRNPKSHISSNLP